LKQLPDYILETLVEEVENVVSMEKKILKRLGNIERGLFGDIKEVVFNKWIQSCEAKNYVDIYKQTKGDHKI
jgi:chorismate mutase